MTTALRTLFTLAAIIFCGTIANADNTRVLESYGEIPLAFTANGGQLDSPVKFTTTGGGCSMFFTPTGTTFLLGKKSDDAPASFAAKLLFNGANPNPKISGEEPLPWKSNYFTGDKSQWHTGVTNYGKVRLSGVYDGIDLVYYGNQKKIEYDFVVSPGKSPAQISLTYDLGADGETALSVNDAGELVVKTPLGNLVEHKPYCYQVIDGEKVEVPGAYRITDAAANTFGFELGEYDTGYPLCIDPVLVYSTFLGDTGDEGGNNIAVDASGNTYITGHTTGSMYPTTPGALDTDFNGGYNDIFVTKLNPAGNALVYSTYIGGNENEQGDAIAVDAAGNAYITGHTCSVNFPVTAGAIDTTYAGTAGSEVEDVFVTKLNSSGNALVYSTFLGGNLYDKGNGIAVDDSGNAYVAGRTQSEDFLATAGSVDTTFNGIPDAFVTKLNPGGTALVYSTYLGGGIYDEAFGITLDDSGNVYVTGETASSDYPTTIGAFNTSWNGGTDAFVTKLNPSGSALVYSTYLGGSGADKAYDIAIDDSGNAYVAGETGSLNFSVTTATYDTSFNGSRDAFVTKLNPSGSGLVYSTYLGGTNTDNGYGIALDDSGNVYVAGTTASSDYPTTIGALDVSLDGSTMKPGKGSSGGDAFVTKLNANGIGLIYSTYLGGIGLDIGNGIALDDSGNVYVTGGTESSDFPTTPGAYDESFGPTADIFVTKLNMNPGTLLTVTTPNGSEIWSAGTTEPVTWTSTGTVDSITIELYKESGAMFDRTIAASAQSTGSYAWTIPADITPGNSYRVKIIATTDSTLSDMSDADFVIAPGVGVTEVPAAFNVSLPYPNPFNPSTALAVQIPETITVRVVMYNSLGQEVRVLYDGIMGAGLHTLVWDGENDAGAMAASGVYFYSVRAGEHSAKGKVMFLR